MKIEYQKLLGKNGKLIEAAKIYQTISSPEKNLRKSKKKKKKKRNWKVNKKRLSDIKKHQQEVKKKK